jgi:hypothetical protein
LPTNNSDTRDHPRSIANRPSPPPTLTIFRPQELPPQDPQSSMHRLGQSWHRRDEIGSPEPAIVDNSSPATSQLTLPHKSLMRSGEPGRHIKSTPARARLASQFG